MVTPTVKIESSQNYFILRSANKIMEGWILLLLAFVGPLFLIPSEILGQSATDETGNNLNNITGGLSAESVSIADSNASNLSETNTTNSHNESGGLSAESVTNSR